LGYGYNDLWHEINLGSRLYSVFYLGPFSLLLSAYLIRSVPIIKNPSQELIPVGAKVLWFLAFLYDLFTAFKGNFDLVLGNVGGTERILLAIGLTIFICSAPVGLSKVLFDPELD